MGEQPAGTMFSPVEHVKITFVLENQNAVPMQTARLVRLVRTMYANMSAMLTATVQTLRSHSALMIIFVWLAVAGMRTVMDTIMCATCLVMKTATIAVAEEQMKLAAVTQDALTTTTVLESSCAMQIIFVSVLLTKTVLTMSFVMPVNVSLAAMKTLTAQ